MEGFVKARVRCPKCGRSFVYKYVPGGSFTAVRLGTYRYFRCQKCGRFALFNIAAGTDRKLKPHVGRSGLIAALALIVLGAGFVMFAESGYPTIYWIALVTFILASIMIIMSFSYGLRRRH